MIFFVSGHFKTKMLNNLLDGEMFQISMTHDHCLKRLEPWYSTRFGQDPRDAEVNGCWCHRTRLKWPCRLTPSEIRDKLEESWHSKVEKLLDHVKIRNQKQHGNNGVAKLLYFVCWRCPVSGFSSRQGSEFIGTGTGELEWTRPSAKCRENHEKYSFCFDNVQIND